MKIQNYKLFLNLEKEEVKVNEEVGLRNLKKIAKSLDRMDQALVGSKSLEKNPSQSANMKDVTDIVKDSRKCEMYFHKDLDGVTSALAMKQILKGQYQIETVDCHTIQYGGLEFAVQPPKEGNLAVLVDFAHSKPMFTIATDHHQEQVGAEDTSSTYYKHSRSNVETISGEIAKQEIFPQGDIEFIQTIDSANFLKWGIEPSNLHQSIFKLDKNQPIEKIKFTFGFVVNRLLLAYKNKRITCKSLDGKRDHINRNLLECLVLDCSPNLYSMFNNLTHYIKHAKTSDKLGTLANPEDLSKNLASYKQTMKTYKDKKYDEEYKIIQQYGGGSMVKPGSYDRYVVFENTPDAEFLCIVWPMGLIQVSCNPFKEKKLQDINLGEIAKEVLGKYESVFKRYFISLEAIKQVYETSQDWTSMQKSIGDSYVGIGFKFSDLESFYIDCIYNKQEKVANILNKVLEIDFRSNSEKYEDIDVIIDFNGKKYQFKTTEIDSIKEFVGICGKLGLNAENKLIPFTKSNSYQEVEEFVSDISKKQIEGAKNNIANLLKSNELMGNGIVSKRDKITVFEGLPDSRLKEAMDTNYEDLTPEQKNYLSSLKIPVWELIIRNSGGHPSITNISGLNFLAYNKKVMKIVYKTDNYTDILKQIARDFVNNLKEKIDVVNAGESVVYDTKGIELYGQDANESFEYQIVDKDTGLPKQVTKDDFLKAGVEKAMRPDRKSLMTIDTENKRVIAKFESFNNSKL
jgi:hypothetical protein